MRMTAIHSIGLEFSLRNLLYFEVWKSEISQMVKLLAVPWGSADSFDCSEPVPATTVQSWEENSKGQLSERARAVPKQTGSFFCSVFCYYN